MLDCQLVRSQLGFPAPGCCIIGSEAGCARRPGMGNVRKLLGCHSHTTFGLTPVRAPSCCMRGLGALPLLVSSLAADVHASAGLEMPRRARVRRSATHADQVDQQGERYEDQDFEGAIRVNTADTDGRSDHSEHCAAWAAAGECDVNPDFMCAHPRQQMPTIPFAALALNLSARTHSLAFPALAPSVLAGVLSVLLPVTLVTAAARSRQQR